MKNTKKMLACITALVLLAVPLAGCSQAQQSSQQGSETSVAQTETMVPEAGSTTTADDEDKTDAEAEPASTGDATVATYNDMPTTEAEGDSYELKLANEVYNYKLIRNVPVAYESEGWDSYCAQANVLLNIEPTAIGEAQEEMIDMAYAARQALVQLRSAADCMLYIWGDSMPSVVAPAELEFTLESYDNADFAPFLVPYLLDDPTEAKGIMIAIAGGGYSSRGNAMEGYPIAEEFNKLGYNAFVLQRRVEPYCMEDIWMDLQRSVRYIRHNADDMGLGGTDCIAASGFSGGCATILGTVANLYGDIQPTKYDLGYSPDEVDAENADMDAVFAMYGPRYYTMSFTEEFQGLVTDNPNLPAMFIGGGEDDTLGEDNIILAESVRGKALVETHTFAKVGHGFGVGLAGTNSLYWIPMADRFMDLAMGRGESAPVAETAEIPPEYTKMQTYTITAGFGDAEVTCAMDEDESKFFLYFTAFDALQILEGLLEDGEATITYDQSGFMSGDIYNLLSGIKDDAWVMIS